MFFKWRQKIIIYLFYFNFIALNITHAYLKVLTPLSALTEADLGSYLVLPCNVSGQPTPRIIWLKDGQALSKNLSWEPPFEGRETLVSYAVNANDSGNYTCLASNFYESKKLNTKLLVKTPPAKIQNFSVHPSTVLATVRWHVDDDGGYPITNFTLMYKPTHANASESWHIPQPFHISPTVRQFFIYQLKPGTDYIFKIWATNKLGAGEPVSVRASTAKPVDPPEIFQKMLADAEDFGSTAWLVAICMVAGTVLTLSLLSCALIYKEQKHAHHRIPWKVVTDFTLRTAALLDLDIQSAVKDGMDNSSPSDNLKCCAIADIEVAPADTPEETLPRIIANPGFEIDLEQSYLLDHADCNDNTEQTVRINNNTVIQPSRV